MFLFERRQIFHDHLHYVVHVLLPISQILQPEQILVPAIPDIIAVLSIDEQERVPSLLSDDGFKTIDVEVRGEVRLVLIEVGL